MADKRVRIVITGKDEASQALKSVDNSLLSIAKTVAGVTIALKALQVGADIIKDLARGAWDLAQAAAPIPGISTAFATMGGNIEQLRRATMGMVSDRALMLRYNEAAQLVSETFAQTLPEAMQMLTKVSRATGRDLDYLMTSYVTAVGRGSKLIADNMAITVDWARANEDMAASLGKTVEQLTEQEIQTGRANHVLELLRQNTAKLPDAAGSAQQKFGTLQSTLDNLRDSAGVKLLGPMGDLAGLMTDIAEDVGPELIDTIEKLATEVGPELISWLRDVLAIVPDVVDWLAKLTVSTRTVSKSIFEGAGTYQEYYNKIMQCPRALALFKHDLDESEVATALMKEGLLLSADAFDKLKFGLDEANLRLETSDMRMRNAKLVAEQLAPAIEDVGKSAIDMGAVFDMLKIDKAMAGIRDVIKQHGIDVKALEQSQALEQLNVTFKYQADRMIAEAKFRAELKQLQDAGDAEGIAKLQQTYAESQAMTEWNAGIQEQMRAREALVAEYQEKVKWAEMLKEQYEAAKLSIQVDTLTALAKSEINKETASAILETMGISLNAMLQAEGAYGKASSDVFWKWSQNVTGSVATNIGALAAWNLAMQGQIRAAEAAVTGALSNLKSMQLKLPTLELPALPGMEGAGAAAGRAAERSVEELVSQTTETITRGLDAVREFLDNVATFKVPPGYEATVDSLIDAMGYIARQFVPALESLREEFGDKLLLETEETAGNIDAILGLLGNIEDMMKAQKYETKAGFAEIMKSYVADLEMAGRALMDWLRTIKPEWATMLKTAADIAEDAKKVFGLLGIDLSKSVPGGADFRAAISRYVSQLEYAGARLMDWLRKIKPEWAEMLKEAVPIAEDAKTLFGLLGIDLAKSVPVKDAALFESNMTKYVSQLEFAGARIMDWMKRIKPEWRKMVKDAAPVAEDIQKVLGILSVDLSKVAGYKGIPETTFRVIMRDIEKLANDLVDMANRIKSKIDEKTKTTITVLNEAFSGIKDALDTVLALANLRDPKTGKTTYKSIFEAVPIYGTQALLSGQTTKASSKLWDMIRRDIEALVNEMSKWNLTADMDRMKGVNVILAEAKTTIDFMVSMIQDINAVMEKGGLNVNAARALFSQFSNFLRMPGWIGGWQFGTPDTGSPTAGGNGTLAITIQRMEIYAGDAVMTATNITGQAAVAKGTAKTLRLLSAGKAV